MVPRRGKLEGDFISVGDEEDPTPTKVDRASVQEVSRAWMSQFFLSVSSLINASESLLHFPISHPATKEIFFLISHYLKGDSLQNAQKNARKLADRSEQRKEFV